MDRSKDYVCDGDYRTVRPYVPEGVYMAECIDYDDDVVYRGIPKLYLKFRLVNVVDPDEPDRRVELPLIFNMPWDARIPPRSKYHRAWSKANGRMPSRDGKMSPRVFLNKVYMVTVRTVKPKEGGVELPADFHYSIVDSIRDIA